MNNRPMSSHSAILAAGAPAAYRYVMEKVQKSGSGDRKGDAARADRLKAALRENLKRRKAQVRGRARPEDTPHDSAGIVPDKSGE